MDRSAKRSGNTLREVVETLVIALLVAFLIRSFVIESFQVEGRSMLPTLHNGDRVLVNKLLYRFSHPKTGQIVVFQSPVIKNQDWIKRVIGVPGDTVAVRNNQVYLNGKLYPEPFLRYTQSVNVPPTHVPPGYLWVEGDNRPQSFDSRSFGLLPMGNLKGQAFVVWWPLSQVRWLK